MKALCNPNTFLFPASISRSVIAQFNGGDITSDAGGLRLRQVERATGILRPFAACFTSHRRPERIEHQLEKLLAQRIYALALGYEDLNDHDDHPLVRFPPPISDARRSIWLPLLPLQPPPCRFHYP
jgi:hypothetical protein